MTLPSRVSRSSGTRRAVAEEIRSAADDRHPRVQLQLSVDFGCERFRAAHTLRHVRIEVQPVVRPDPSEQLKPTDIVGSRPCLVVEAQGCRRIKGHASSVRKELANDHLTACRPHARLARIPSSEALEFVREDYGSEGREGDVRVRPMTGSSDWLHSSPAGARFRAMELLSNRDVTSLLGFVHEASEVEGPEPFTEAVVEAFWQLIPADAGAACNTFSGASPTVDPQFRTVLSFSAVDCEWCTHVQAPWTDELDAICKRYVERQDPHPPVPKFINRPVRRSDLVERATYRRSGLWAEVERRVGAEDALCLWLEVPGETVLRRFLFVTGRRGGLRDRDMRVLELLTPHLIRLYVRAARRKQSMPGLEILTPREREIITLVAAGRTNRETARYLWISPHTVRQHLENIFEKLEVTTRTAAVAKVLGGPPAA